MTYQIGDTVRIKSLNIVANIISISIEVGSQILTLSKGNEIIWNDNFRTWDESQVEPFNEAEFKAFKKKTLEKYQDEAQLYIVACEGLFGEMVRFEGETPEERLFTVEIELDSFSTHLDADTSKAHLMSEEEFLDSHDWIDSAQAMYDLMVKGNESFNIHTEER